MKEQLNFQKNKINGKSLQKVQTKTLLNAVIKGDFSEVKITIEKGCFIDVSDQEGKTALIYAIEGNKFNIVEYLINKGTNINKQDYKGTTPLIYAIKNKCLEITRLLLQNGAEVNVKDMYNKNSLLYSLEENDFELAQLLITNKGDINSKNNIGETPLMHAIKFKNLPLIKYLIKNKCELNAKNNIGKTALTYAVEYNFNDGIKILIENGADFNCKNNNGQTLLHIAVKNKLEEITSYLLSKMSYEFINIKDTICSALEYAVYSKNFNISNRICIANISHLLLLKNSYEEIKNYYEMINKTHKVENLNKQFIHKKIYDKSFKETTQIQNLYFNKQQLSRDIVEYLDLDKLMFELCGENSCVMKLTYLAVNQINLTQINISENKVPNELIIKFGLRNSCYENTIVYPIEPQDYSLTSMGENEIQ